MSKREILSSWKEIANYLNIKVRTEQRWEKELNLPIHRVDGAPGTYVYAYPDELNSWLKKKDIRDLSHSQTSYQLGIYPFGPLTYLLLDILSSLCD